MRTVVRILALVLLAAGVALGGALVLALEATPRVVARDDVAPADVDRAVELAKAHDPRHAVPGRLQVVALRERDVDLLAQYAARRWLSAPVKVELQSGGMHVLASLQGPAGRWWNLDLGLRQTERLPVVDRLQVGRLPLPSALAMPLARAVAAHRGVDLDALLAGDAVAQVSLEADRLVVAYRTGAGTGERLRSALLKPADEARLRAHAERLATWSRGVTGAEAPLADALATLLALAQQRSAGGGDAAAENRAALLVLTFFANQRPLAALLPAAGNWTAPRPLTLLLQKRADFPLHFLISAVISAEAGTPLADAVGVWKELADARRGGSGFSFNDLAADRAGTRFGERAVRDATRLQARMAAGVSEAAFMPDASDLPEFMPEAEFVARYGGVGAPAYGRMIATIEARVDALSLFR